MNSEAGGFIHRFIPAASGDSEETLLLLHGTGGDENDLIPLGEALAPGAAILSPRGKVLENGMPRFFRRLAEGVFDLEDLKFRTQELADFIPFAARTYGFDPAKVLAVGFSNGANIAASLLLLRPGLLSGAILLHPMVPLVPDPLPDLAGVLVFIGAGQFDPIIPPAETQRLVDLLEHTGAKVTLHWEEAGHSITRPEVRAAKEWVARRP